MAKKLPLTLDDEGQVEQLQPENKLDGYPINEDIDETTELIGLLVLEMLNMGFEINNKKLLNLLKKLK